MFECLIIGDSIAVGIAAMRPDCESIAEVGITSGEFVRRHISDDRLVSGYSTVVISLGTNDWDGNRTRKNLLKLREIIGAERVMWMLPSASLKPEERAAVKQVAAECGDGVINVPDHLLSKDKIHLTNKGYGAMASEF